MSSSFWCVEIGSILNIVIYKKEINKLTTERGISLTRTDYLAEWNMSQSYIQVIVTTLEENLRTVEEICSPVFDLQSSLIWHKFWKLYSFLLCISIPLRASSNSILAWWHLVFVVPQKDGKSSQLLWRVIIIVVNYTHMCSYLYWTTS